MNKNKISKLFHISTTNNKQESAADIILKSHLYEENNLVLDYLENFQNVNPVRFYSGIEYVQHYSIENDQIEEKERKGIVIGDLEQDELIEFESLLRSRKSYRIFSYEIKKKELFALLNYSLREKVNVDGDYRRTYPSGGALYPIRLLLYISGVDGIDDGVYLYDHRGNELVFYNSSFSDYNMNEVLAGQRISFGKSKILVMYVYDLLQNYIKYHDIALSLAFIEVGAISQTIQLLAPKCEIGYCDIGGFPKGKMEKWLKLNNQYFHIIHVGVMGGIDNEV